MINIDKQLVITRDRYQWILSERACRKRDGKQVTYLRPQGFYPSLEGILLELVQRRAVGQEYAEILALLEDQQETLTQLCTQLTQLMDDHWGKEKKDERQLKLTLL